MVTLSPTIMDDGTYCFRFYARDVAHHPHDPHIHVVARDGSGAKFSLDPVAFGEQSWSEGSRTDQSPERHRESSGLHAGGVE